MNGESRAFFCIANSMQKLTTKPQSDRKQGKK
jgi:hypothetical protein